MKFTVGRRRAVTREEVLVAKAQGKSRKSAGCVEQKSEDYSMYVCMYACIKYTWKCAAQKSEIHSDHDFGLTTHLLGNTFSK